MRMIPIGLTTTTPFVVFWRLLWKRLQHWRTCSVDNDDDKIGQKDSGENNIKVLAEISVAPTKNKSDGGEDRLPRGPIIVALVVGLFSIKKGTHTASFAKKKNESTKTVPKKSQNPVSFKL